MEPQSDYVFICGKKKNEKEKKEGRRTFSLHRVKYLLY